MVGEMHPFLGRNCVASNRTGKKFGWAPGGGGEQGGGGGLLIP